MGAIPTLLIDRFRRLPRRSSEAWQGGFVRLPDWVDAGPDGKPYRPWAAVWVSLTTGVMNVKIDPAPGARDWTVALDALLELGLKRGFAGCRPARLEVADEPLGRQIADALGDPELGLAVVDALPAVRQVLRQMGDDLRDGPPPPAALDAPGVTVERMRGFAAAAARFYEAQPWRHLTDEDLIQVEAPAIVPALRYATVLGAGGRSFGLAFFASVEDFESAQREADPDDVLGPEGWWSVTFSPAWEFPFADVDLWEERGLPVAGQEAYPLAVWFGPDEAVRRPDAAALADMEGLLLALAETTEEELDRGRWSREVRTHDGPRAFTLCVPALLHPLEVDLPDPATTPLDLAQDLADAAMDASGRRRIQLARKALEVSPDCPDAYGVLAEASLDPERALELYREGVAAGERALGPEALEEHAGSLWGWVGARPYMRVRFGLGQCLEDLGRTEEAIVHYADLLRLNPGDHQGVRYRLLPALLVTGRDDEAGALLGQFDDGMATWLYGRALWTFRREGDSAAAREQLREAGRANRRVAKYLTGEVDEPDELPESFTLGSEEEAVICTGELGEAWAVTPGAEEWLSRRAASRPRRKRRRRS